MKRLGLIFYFFVFLFTSLYTFPIKNVFLKTSDTLTNAMINKVPVYYLKIRFTEMEIILYILLFILIVGYIFIFLKKIKTKYIKLKKEIEKYKKSEKILKNERNKFRSLLYAADNIYFEIDKSYKIVDVIVSNEANLYKPTKEILGKTLLDIFGEERGKKFIKEIQNIFKTNSSGKIEYSLTIRGIKKYFEALLVNYQDENVLIIVREITDIKEKNEIFHLFSDIISKSISIVVVTDFDGNIIYVNPRFFEVTGYSLTEVIGKNPRILKSGKHKKEFYKNLWDTIKSRKVWHDVIINKKKGGELYWEDAYITPVENDKREITHFFKVAEDITSLVKTRDELKKEEILFKTYLEAANALIVGFGEDYRVQIINSTGAEILGYSKDKILGKDWIENFIPKDDRGSVREYLDAIFKGDKVKKKNKNRILCKNNQIKTILWQNVILNRDNNPLIIGSGIDISIQERDEKIRNILRKILYYVLTVKELDDFYKKIRFQLNRIIDATNMFIVLKENSDLKLVFNIDEKDNMKVLPKRKTLSEYVLKKGESVFLTKEDILKLIKEGKAELVGSLPLVWIGIPLKIKNKSIGILGLQSYTQKDVFSKEDLSYLEMVSVTIAMAIRHKQYEKAIAENLKEKNQLLKEVHHRVKNNLQFIFSMFRIQNRFKSSDEINEFVIDNVNRIKVMSILQNMLYEDEKIVDIDIYFFFYKIMENIINSLRKRVRFEVNVKNISLDYNVSLPLGLIVNELVTNSFKHAFKGKEYGQVIISMEREGENYVLEISDNGVGLPETINLENPETFGLLFVDMQIQQISGKLEYIYDNGAKFRIKFKEVQLATFGKY